MSEKRHRYEESKKARDELVRTLVDKGGMKPRDAERVATDTATKVDQERKSKG
jgi:polyhydroxyalkanoate synthesis regulator phasin